MLRIVRANFRVFTLDAGFIKQEKSKLKGWALYTLYSMDSNANLVCLAHCLYEKENQEGYDRLLGLCQEVKMDDEGTTFQTYLNKATTAILADRHSGTHSRFVFSSSS